MADIATLDAAETGLLRRRFDGGANDRSAVRLWDALWHMLWSIMVIVCFTGYP